MEEVDNWLLFSVVRLEGFPLLGLPLGLGLPHKSCILWDAVEERFNRRLDSWKKQYLSKRGRLILLKSTLSNFPILVYVPLFYS